MTHMTGFIEALIATNDCFPGSAALAASGLERQRSFPRLLSPADPLTSLLMQADGVTEAELDALVRWIAKRRERLCSCQG